MGSQMASRLRSAGHDVRVWNRTDRKAKEWAREGGTACGSPKEAATGTLEAHLMVKDDEAVDSVLFSADGALAGLGAGGLVVDHSTVSYDGAKARSERLLRSDWRFLQAPLLASPTAVRQGDGLMLAAGDRGAYDEAQSTLQQIIKKQWWVGENAEQAAAFKLMANSVLVSIVEALAEFFAIGKACDIAPDHALTLFDFFDPAATIKLRGPRMAKSDYTAAFTLAMARKDIGLVLRASTDADSMAALTAIQEKMDRLIKRGHGHLDLSALSVETLPPGQRS